jgi:hypothetical protein
MSVLTGATSPGETLNPKDFALIADLVDARSP